MAKYLIFFLSPPIPRLIESKFAAFVIFLHYEQIDDIYYELLNAKITHNHLIFYWNLSLLPVRCVYLCEYDITYNNTYDLNVWLGYIVVSQWSSLTISNWYMFSEIM